ncbi:cation/H(+) antiporter 24 [Diospyros lotus]|uniref:cation/H(+) antiporter 24 n=1 Tax=Diospyros lotus TaxID=55363 RepID=UPI00225A8990|nr:cation/H(+) antiporter 24 [Diospyros lotus]
MFKVSGDSDKIDEAPFICREIQKAHSPGIFYAVNPLNYSFTLLLIELSIIVLVTCTLRFLLRPLRQPRIVSEILGGIIIGPSVLGRNEAFAKYVFPDNATHVFKNIGLIGFLYFLFLAGVKMDLSILKKTGKKQWYTVGFGIAVPLFVVLSIAIDIWKSLDKALKRVHVIGGLASAFAITSFPVLYQVIKELNLLGSDVGQLALSTVMASDLIGITFLIAFEAARGSEAEAHHGLWVVLSMVGILGLIGGLRAAMNWIVRTTPEGKPVEQAYVVSILVSVMVVAFISDITGVSLVNGPLWLGLAVPDGPPLGATLVERTETFITELLMPFSYAFVGMYTDVFTLPGHWSSLLPILAMAVAAYLAKVVTTTLVSRYFEIPIRDGITLGLIMSLRGQVELLVFMHWMDLKIIEVPSFTVLVLLAVMMTGIATPLISILNDPTRPYMINKRRAIQYTPPNAELHIVACVHDQESVAGFINLLDVSNPTVNSPFTLYALHLIELAGRATPVFIDLQSPAHSSEQASFNPIHHALTFFQASRGEHVQFQLFRAITPARAMFHDICRLALKKKAVLIILPFKKEDWDGRTEVMDYGGLQAVNSNVLAHAPCSVGILVDKGAFQSRHVNFPTPRTAAAQHHFAVLFLGGSDCREALAYADRMAGNPDVWLTAIRFLSQNGEGDDEMEKKLDDGLVTWFWMKNEANEQVIYKEVVVRNGADTVGAIRAMNNNRYFDLWIVGRKNGINPVLLSGLSDWSQNHELGVIGDYIAAVDQSSNASVLVVQQQVLR